MSEGGHRVDCTLPNERYLSLNLPDNDIARYLNRSIFSQMIPGSKAIHTNIIPSQYAAMILNHYKLLEEAPITIADSGRKFVISSLIRFIKLRQEEFFTKVSGNPQNFIVYANDYIASCQPVSLNG
jgi:hypothetical protein